MIIGVRLARPPDLEGAGEAPGNQHPARVELRTPTRFDELAAEIHPVDLPSRGAARGRLDDDSIDYAHHRTSNSVANGASKNSRIMLSFLGVSIGGETRDDLRGR